MQRAALGAARVLARRPPGDRVLVTLQDTGGDFGVSGRAGERAWSGGLPGLVKTAAAEWPDAAVKAIDVACSDVSLDEVADRVVRRAAPRRARRGGRPRRRRPSRHLASSTRGVSAHQARRGADEAGRRAGRVGRRPRGTATSIAALCKVRPRLALLGRTELGRRAGRSSRRGHRRRHSPRAPGESHGGRRGRAPQAACGRGQGHPRLPRDPRRTSRPSSGPAPP